MPRRRRSGGRSAPRARSRSAPKPVNHAPSSVTVQSGRDGGSFLGTIAYGLAFGTASAVAHRAVDAVMGPPTITHETVAIKPAVAAAAVPAANANSLGGDACNVQTKAFTDCLNSYGNEISKCQFYMNILAECRKNSGATLSV